MRSPQRNIEVPVQLNHTVEAPDSNIHDDIKALLGAIHNSPNKEGPELHEEIVTRWDVVLKKGLDKESRSELIEKYPICKNCPSLYGLKINGEIASGLSDDVSRQDNFLVMLQNYIACAISAVGNPLNQMITQGDKNNPLVTV